MSFVDLQVKIKFVVKVKSELQSAFNLSVRFSFPAVLHLSVEISIFAKCRQIQMFYRYESAFGNGHSTAVKRKKHKWNN